jgi:hypothetical protein
MAEAALALAVDSYGHSPEWAAVADGHLTETSDAIGNVCFFWLSHSRKNIVKSLDEMACLSVISAPLVRGRKGRFSGRQPNRYRGRHLFTGFGGPRTLPSYHYCWLARRVDLGSHPIVPPTETPTARTSM